jgi:hypothetical protein
VRLISLGEGESLVGIERILEDKEDELDEPVEPAEPE